MRDGRHTAEVARGAAFIDFAEALRPELHRYCSRLLGSVIDGEDVVQDTLARAFAAGEELRDVRTPRAWLFSVAHNRAMDVLRGRAIRVAEPLDAADGVVDEAAPDPEETLMRREAVKTAVSRFTELPVPQRSVVILKDVLDEPLAGIAALLGLTVDSVKAHLARGRARLRDINATQAAKPAARPPSALVAHYVALFNAHDWAGLKAMLADDVRLVQATHPPRVGAADVGMFFGIYAKVDGVLLVPAWLEGREVIAVFEGAAATPAYFMRLAWRDGRIGFIGDYRHARYVMAGAELTLASGAG
ncbi:MAG: sigma-70 family RNA polymerase sigma factor [Hyphomicrobiales bacterium]|nr:sigma-70 family RNA polymerase sigma factor [Hyphomicrobiales bacterium]MDE2017345.1 sigma-70 family RNA polymerase sigma factor [Hyphomicrobiales bacterium]